MIQMVNALCFNVEVKIHFEQKKTRHESNKRKLFALKFLVYGFV